HTSFSRDWSSDVCSSDLVGQFHEVDPQTRQPIDTRATLPDGTELNGPADLNKALARRGDQLAQVITEKLMTYAVGRHVEYRDMRSEERRVGTEGEARGRV